MMACGSSERGLSEVTIARSLRRAAISPMSGRLVRSRSPPQPKTQMIRSAVSSRRAESACSRASGVWE